MTKQKNNGGYIFLVVLIIVAAIIFFALRTTNNEKQLQNISIEVIKQLPQEKETDSSALPLREKIQNTFQRTAQEFNKDWNITLTLDNINANVSDNQVQAKLEFSCNKEILFKQESLFIRLITDKLIEDFPKYFGDNNISIVIFKGCAAEKGWHLQGRDFRLVE